MIVTTREGGSNSDPYQRGDQSTPLITASLITEKEISSMIEFLDRQQTLTGHQRRIVIAAILGDMLEFFDYFLVGFVLVFIAVPWHLTYGQSAIILLSSGIGAIVGAFLCGALADRVGRRKVFIATVIIFSVGTGILAFTPEKA